MDIFNVQYFSQNLFVASLICVSHVSLDLRSSTTQSKLLHTTFCEVIDMKTACKKKNLPGLLGGYWYQSKALHLRKCFSCLRFDINYFTTCCLALFCAIVQVLNHVLLNLLGDVAR